MNPVDLLNNMTTDPAPEQDAGLAAQQVFLPLPVAPSLHASPSPLHQLVLCGPDRAIYVLKTAPIAKKHAIMMKGMNMHVN